MKHEFLEAVPLYALDALSGAEKRRLEEHLKNGCDICEPELRIFQETGARLPYALPNVPLPAELKEKIWDCLQAEPARATATRFNWVPFAFAALLALFAIGLWRMNESVARRDQEIMALETQLEKQKREIDWLRDPSVQLALLTGLDPASQSKGKMLWNPSQSRGLFYVNLLPPLSAEKAYQLWVIGNQGPVSAGVFSPNKQGNAVITISKIEGTAQGSLQFAVTIEPRGGVPQPTGSMVLAGKPL